MANDSPAIILYDNSGNPVGVILEGTVYKLQAQVTGAAPAGSAVDGNPVLIAGSDGTNVRTIKTDGSGNIQVTTGTTTNKVAYDIGDTYIYIGTAALGSATSDSVWLIKRTTLVAGDPTFTEWSSSTAVWDDRNSESYQ